MSRKIVSIRGEQTEVDLHALPFEVVAVHDGELEARVDGRTVMVPFAVQGTAISFAYDGETYFAEVTEKGRGGARHHREANTSAPMPGLVLKILVAQGDVVAKGSPLLILEAMKMEHQIAAPFDGSVKAIRCREGELVQAGVELVEIERNENHG